MSGKDQIFKRNDVAPKVAPGPGRLSKDIPWGTTGTSGASELITRAELPALDPADQDIYKDGFSGVSQDYRN